MPDSIFVKKSLLYRKIIIWAALILFLALLAIFFVIRFADSQYSRDLRNLEIIVSITADTRAQNIEAWVNNQENEINDVANNVTVQLYLTERDLAQGNTIDQEDAQIEFITNYLEATAQRAGFVNQTQAPKINANIENIGEAGIAVVTNDGKIITATHNFPSMTKERLRDFIGKKPETNDIYLSDNMKFTIAFSKPIFPVQGDHLMGTQIGWVVGIRDVSELYKILTKPKTIYKTAESILVRKSDGVIGYISPLKNNMNNLKLSTKRGNKDLAANFAIDNTGKFSIIKDYNSVETFVTGRKIAATKWTMLHKIDRKEALYNSDKRREAIVTISTLIIGLLVMVIFAVWRHGSSVRYKHLAQQFRSQEKLLRLVTDNQQDKIFIIDQENRYCFANRKVAKAANLQDNELLGKTIENVFGPAKEEKYSSVIKTVKEKPIKQVQRFEDNDDTKIVQIKYVPLQQVPEILTGDMTSGTLVVEHDITDVISQKEKRERLLGSVIDTLVSVVDSRDHYSADQSKNVANLAKNVAKELHVNKNIADTTIIAARLMNLGKIIAPRELLNKQGKLTAAERKLMNSTREASADFIKDLEFDGPVESTIRQMQERWDGSGPLGLKGDESLISARIISIANEYVAMTSPRSYRDKMSQEKAINIFMDEIGKKYERKLVVALVNHLENNTADDDVA